MFRSRSIVIVELDTVRAVDVDGTATVRATLLFVLLLGEAFTARDDEIATGTCAVFVAGDAGLAGVRHVLHSFVEVGHLVCFDALEGGVGSGLFAR